MNNITLYALNLDSPTELKRAIKVANQFNSELYLCYVTDLDEEKQQDTLSLGKPFAELVINNEMQSLYTKIETMIANTPIPKANVYILNGDVGEAIEQFAQSVDANLVIISRTHHKFRLLMNHQADIERHGSHDIYILSHHDSSK